MKSILPIFCLIVGLGLGGVAGHFHGVAVTLQSQYSYQQAVMADLAEKTETRHR